LHCKNTGWGSPCARKEDDTLVRGKGKYTDDFHPARPGLLLDGALQPCPWDHQGDRHGRAKAMPACSAPGPARISKPPVTTLHLRLPLKSRDGSPLLQTNRPALATDKVRFVGDPIAFVVAETLAQARDAAEAIELDIESLPAVTDAAEATKPGAPLL